MLHLLGRENRNARHRALKRIGRNHSPLARQLARGVITLLWRGERRAFQLTAGRSAVMHQRRAKARRAPAIEPRVSRRRTEEVAMKHGRR